MSAKTYSLIIMIGALGFTVLAQKSTMSGEKTLGNKKSIYYFQNHLPRKILRGR